MVRRITGVCTHDIIPRLIPRDQHSIGLLLGFCWDRVIPFEDSRLRALDHGVLGSATTSAVEFFGLVRFRLLTYSLYG